MRVRRVCRPMVAMSTPSTKMRPDSASSNRNNVWTTVDFPLPVRPTTPTRLEGGMEKLTDLSANGSVDRYRTDKS